MSFFSSPKGLLVSTLSVVLLSEIIYRVYIHACKGSVKGSQNIKRVKRAHPLKKRRKPNLLKTSEGQGNGIQEIALIKRHYPRDHLKDSEDPETDPKKAPPLPPFDFQRVIPPNSDEDSEVWNTALFFPDFAPNNVGSLTRRFIWYLEQITDTLKICMYTANFRPIENAVFNLAGKKGITVLGITNVGRVVGSWKRKGILIREKPKVVQSPFDESIYMDLMHNKFIILDDKVVMGGSMNWTTSGVTENRENVVITNNQKIVLKYVEEFDRLWAFSEPDPTKVRNKRKENRMGRNVAQTKSNDEVKNESPSVPLFAFNNSKI